MKESEYFKMGFSTGKPFEAWSKEEREDLEEFGLGEGGLALFKVVALNESGVSVSSMRCQFSCSQTTWEVGKNTVELHSLPNRVATAGLHAAAFWYFDNNWLKNVRSSVAPSQALLLNMNPKHFLATRYNQVKASQYFVLDSLDTGSEKSEQFRTLILENARNYDALQLVGMSARSWDDVIRILSEGNR